MKCKDPECNRKCDCCDEEMTQDVMSAVAASDSSSVIQPAWQGRFPGR